MAHSAATKAKMSASAKKRAAETPTYFHKTANMKREEPAREPVKFVLYSDEVAAEILERLACGESLTRICKDDRMPSRAGVLQWIYREKKEPFASQYAQARLEQLYGIADEMRDIADDGSNDFKVSDEGKVTLDKEHVMRSKLRIDTRKWELSKLLANIFGDKLQHTGEGGGALVVNIKQFTPNAGS